MSKMGEIEEKSSLYYFAHPYTVKDKAGNNVQLGEEANFNLSNIRMAELLKRGIMAYSPISHTHPIHVREPEFIGNNEYKLWIDLDNLIINKTQFNGIILAPGWEKSKGCLREKEMFEQKGLEVLFYKEIVK